MIFISHLLRSLYYSSLNQHCIICYNLILLRHIIGDIERPLIFRSFYVSICYKDLIDLHHKHQNFILLFSHINISICCLYIIFCNHIILLLPVYRMHSSAVIKSHLSIFFYIYVCLVNCVHKPLCCLFSSSCFIRDGSVSLMSSVSSLINSCTILLDEDLSFS